MEKIKFSKEEQKQYVYTPIFVYSDKKEFQEGDQMYGKIRYDEGSVYLGNLIYTHSNFEKYGYGEQDFTKSRLNVSTNKPNLKLYKYIGQYDYRKTNWIYGDGILYFVDKNNKPAGYVSGFYEGLNRIKKFKTFNKDLLLNEFKETEELKIIPFLDRFTTEISRANKKETVKTVLIGDSWFEFYQTHIDKKVYQGTFKTDTKGLDIINLGVGGTTCKEWIKYFKKTFKHLNFENIIINLGFNDLHLGRKEEAVMKDFIKLFNLIIEKNKNANIYVNTVCHSLYHPQFVNQENNFNRMLKEYKSIKINIINTVDELDKYPLTDIFASDGVHLNKFGYKVWHKLFINDKLPLK